MPSQVLLFVSNDFLLLVAVALVFLLAGIVKGVVGLGLPTLSLGLLAGLMLPGQAAALLVLPSLLTNIWQMWDGPALAALLRRLWPLQLGVVLGTLMAPVSLVTLDVHIASAGLGLALVVYALAGLFSLSPPAPGRAEGAVSLATGLVTGAVTSATGVFVFPAVPYLQSLKLKKEEMVQALGLSFTVSTLALFARLVVEGSFSAGQMKLGGWGVWIWLAPVPAAFLGMALGQKLRGRLDEKNFRRVFFVGLLLIGIYMLARGALR